MLISVCINSHNEGPRLRDTVSAFDANLSGKPHEFVVVADEVTDGGADGLAEAVAPGVPVRVIRNAQRVGCGRSKAQAIASAVGDVLVFVDAHQSVLFGDVADMCARALADDCLYTPVVRNIEYDRATWATRPLGSANEIPYDEALRWGRFQYKRYPDEWVRAHHLTDLRMVGVGFAISRKTLDVMGGFNRYVGLHGSQERGISLRAFMCGVPVRLYADVIVGHEYRQGKPRPKGYKAFTAMDQARNFWHAHFVVSGPEAWRAIRPRMERLARGGGDVCAHPEVIAEREAFLARRVRSDADLLELLRVPYPKPQERHG